MADARLAHAMGRPARDVDAVEAQRAARRLLDAVDGADQRALARAVGADNGHDLAGGDLERHSAERLRIAVVEVEAVDLEERGAHSASGSPR